MKRIVVVNAHWNNRGDEAAIRAILDSLLQITSKISITVIFKDKGEILQFPYKDRVSYTTLRFLPTYRNVIMSIFFDGKLGCNEEIKEMIQIIDRADCLIYAPGGAVISDRFWWRKQLEYLLPVAYAEKKKVPVFFAAPSVGPFRKQRQFRSRVLKKVEKLCVREEISYAELEKQGVRENVLVTIDSAFLNEIDQVENQKILEKYTDLNEFLNSGKKNIGITVTDLAWHVEYGKKKEIKGKIKDAFSEFIDWLKKKNINVLLIPQLFGNQNDREYLKTLQAENVFVLSDEFDAYFQQYVISKLHIVVGMRYHSNIFAAKMNIPFVPIIYEEKMKGFVTTAGWQKAAIELEDLSAKMLKNKYIWVEEHHKQLVNELKEKKTLWKNKAKKTESEMLKVVKKLEKDRK